MSADAETLVPADQLSRESSLRIPKDGTIRHFWSQEMIASDPGQDPRGAPDPAPLWTVLDMTPEGRGTDWYPSLAYPA